jgi:hypothetical protein
MVAFSRAPHTHFVSSGEADGHIIETMPLLSVKRRMMMTGWATNRPFSRFVFHYFRNTKNGGMRNLGFFIDSCRQNTTACRASSCGLTSLA